jgi:hypothetical protein
MEIQKQKVYLSLQKFFWVMGWLSAVSCAGFLIYFSISQIRGPYLSDIVWAQRSFGEIYSAITKGVGAVAFAFLMSTVFDILLKGRDENSKRTNIYLKLTCGCFVLRTVGALFWAFYSTIYVPLSYSGHLKFDLDTWISFLNVVLAFEFLLYAVTIWVLFKHFIKMVEFESEVV